MEKSHIGNWKRLHTDESLSIIEEQLTEFGKQNFTKQLHNKYWTGGSSAIIIIIIIIMIYFEKNSILKCLKNLKRTPRKEEAPRELQYLQPVNIPEIRVQTETTKFPIRNIRIAQNTTSCGIEDADKSKEGGHGKLREKNLFIKK